MKELFDIAIVGGGLAGLSAAILQAKAGKNVVLFEKKQYPMHRVCGEYVSMESWDFLQRLGLNLKELQLPKITKLIVTAPNGSLIETDLPLGGFGISRYLLDFELFKIAQKCGVTVLQNTSVQNIVTHNEGYIIETSNDQYYAHKTIGAFGKRSNLDIAWNRPFIGKSKASLNQFIGVKYHIKYNFAKDTIALHNFEDGYCGISAVENDTYCLCYLTRATNLKNSNNDIGQMERQILTKNVHLKAIFEQAQFVWSKPEVISNISFEAKEQFFKDIPLIGDSAGLITPLCGNGMSMALQSAVLAHETLLKNDNSAYQKQWNDSFKTRLFAGRVIQSFFGNAQITNWFLKGLKPFPQLQKWLITQTHGRGF